MLARFFCDQAKNPAINQMMYCNWKTVMVMSLIKQILINPKSRASCYRMIQEKGEGTYHDQTRSEQIILSHPLLDIIVAMLPRWGNSIIFALPFLETKGRWPWIRDTYILKYSEQKTDAFHWKFPLKHCTCVTHHYLLSWTSGQSFDFIWLDQGSCEAIFNVKWFP